MLFLLVMDAFLLMAAYVLIRIARRNLFKETPNKYINAKYIVPFKYYIAPIWIAVANSIVILFLDLPQYYMTLSPLPLVYTVVYEIERRYARYKWIQVQNKYESSVRNIVHKVLEENSVECEMERIVVGMLGDYSKGYTCHILINTHPTMIENFVLYKNLILKEIKGCFNELNTVMISNVSIGLDV